MKVIIEGCTAEELAEYSPYLSVGKEYEVRRVGDSNLARGHDDTGKSISISLKSCAHLPENGKWVEVSK